MFSFTPCSEAEALDLMQPGEYNFTVTDSEIAISKKSGKSMLKLTLAVSDHDKRERLITDYLIESLKYKIIHFCQAVGLEQDYENGAFSASSCIGKSGKCKVIIDEPEPGSRYNPKNAIKDYIKASDSLIQESSTQPKDLFDNNSDIPF